MLTPTLKLPLCNKRIIVTAPRNYANRLAQELVKLGALPFLMPTIEIILLQDFTKLDPILHKLNTFDWITFTSRNGIDAFFQRLEYLGVNSSVLKNNCLCAIGKDAEKLTTLGLEVDLIPTEPSPSGIIAELAEIPDISEQSILVPVPEVVGVPEPDVVPNFIAGLKKLGMEVTPIPTYKTSCLDKNFYPVELDLIRQGKIDLIAFSSTAEIAAFLKMFDDNPDNYQNSAIACFGPYTANNARKLGLDVSIVAEDYSSFAGFAQAIAKFYNMD
ncbi:uroporphyrinogen-III synthase [Mastigocoleus sp. MO_188.B34]|uniref:uroporphyrinogen-III synthase n=1 Tax=Mastigocoleus sp. MO_188.B34 TaxID=3036635 RepID=UPI00262DA449|nr:uroporphyrinogen-III synthase [Mastigocoleus sp. MO_188.B34]MDJ0694705.1 uroporphyrinogen-III synthase [Mastigocoleus sp. MO_188.B34]